jgi:hypothetical protein
VVRGFHHDDVQFVVVDRLERQGGGAVTALRSLGTPQAMTMLGRALQPGDKLIFYDRLRAHNTSKLELVAKGVSKFMRTIVSTVDYEKELTEHELEEIKLDIFKRYVPGFVSDWSV